MRIMRYWNSVGGGGGGKVRLTRSSFLHVLAATLPLCLLVSPYFPPSDLVHQHATNTARAPFHTSHGTRVASSYCLSHPLVCVAATQHTLSNCLRLSTAHHDSHSPPFEPHTAHAVVDRRHAPRCYVRRITVVHFSVVGCLIPCALTYLPCATARPWTFWSWTNRPWPARPTGPHLDPST